jgi:hypothetical protein
MGIRFFRPSRGLGEWENLPRACALGCILALLRPAVLEISARLYNLEGNIFVADRG